MEMEAVAESEVRVMVTLMGLSEESISMAWNGSPTIVLGSTVLEKLEEIKKVSLTWRR